METWETFNNELNNIKSVIIYRTKVEEQIQKLLNKIFNKRVYKEKINIFRFFYDFVIDLSDFLLYCEIKFEKNSLKRYWDKSVLRISEEINRIETSHRNRKLKYLLILIDSHDSTAKMDLKPIYPNILVINLKMLFVISNYVKRNEIYSRLSQNLFKFASGVLYDSFIIDFYDIMQNVKKNRLASILKNFYFNKGILNLNIKKFIEEFINIEKKIDSEKIRDVTKFELKHHKKATSEEIMNILEINEDELKYYNNLKQSEERRLEEKCKSILNRVKNPSLDILIKEFGMDSREANEIGNFMLKNGYITNFPKHITTIILILPPFQAFISFYETNVINQLNKKKFRFIKIYGFFEKKTIEKIIRFSEIIIVDITVYNPQIYFFLGLVEKYKKKIIITYQKLFSIPKFLMDYKIFPYNLNDYDTIKFDLVKYIKKLRHKF